MQPPGAGVAAVTGTGIDQMNDSAVNDQHLAVACIGRRSFTLRR
jgi:hypothetical protein